MVDTTRLHFDTLAVHAGQKPEPITGALMTPVFLTSSYAQESPGRHRGYEYSRTQNPTRDALQGCLAALEDAEHALAFASGLAATDALLHLLEAGDRVLYSDDLYGGTFRLFDKVYRRHGLGFESVDSHRPHRRRARARGLPPAAPLHRDPHEPLAEDRGPRGGRGARPGPRHHDRGGQHLRDAVLPAAAHPRD